MSKLTQLLKRLGAESDLAEAYEKNPQKVMEEAGLSKEEMELLRKGDLEKLEESTGLSSCQKIKSVIKAYDK
ncbi:hypothetical protein [Thiolapillus sp.]|nr:hypothetical protein [Thiolapillus sp.]